VTKHLKARTVEVEKVAVAKYRGGKHISTATDGDEKIEEPLEVVFSLWSMPRLYTEGQQQASQSGVVCACACLITNT
jgi:hypothetical protein